MNIKTIFLLMALLVGGRTAACAGANIFYEATLLDRGNPVSGTYDLKFTLYEKSSGGEALGTAFTNLQVRITNGLIQSDLFCRNENIRLKRGWVEAAIRPGGAEGEFIPMRARVDRCERHAAGAGKACNIHCAYVTLRLHTFRLPFPFDPTQPRRGRGHVSLPDIIARDL